MRIEKFTFNPFQENTYVVINEKKEAMIVDPGCFEAFEEQELTNFIKNEGLTVKEIVATHAHLDHVFGAKYLCEKYNVPFEIPEQDLVTYQTAPNSAKMFGMPELELPEPKLGMAVGKRTFGDLEFEIRFTPGHARGHVVLVFHQNKIVIGGDVLFYGSIGRTDLPGGDFKTLEASIKTQLYTLPDDFTVYSGHGPETTIGREKTSNGFVHG